MQKEVLIIDDDQSSSELERFLINRDFSVSVVNAVGNGLRNINESENPRVVLLNVESSATNGWEVLAQIKREHIGVSVIVIGAGVQTVRRATALGAWDVLPTDTGTERILEVLNEVFVRLSIRSEVSPMPEVEISEDQYSLVGDSEPMFELNRAIGRVAGNKVSVLLEGETGTGKGLVARLIHNDSERADARFITVDCGAVANELRESELLGYERGAFTGARAEGRPGQFELADGGTLFLDEVGNMTPALQETLLNVLQEGEVQRVGGTRTRSVDVRVVSATHQNLWEMVTQRQFREDLYYRLCGYRISVPPLRERVEDISLLVPYFLQRIEQENGRPMYGVSEEVMELFQRYDWPGNVRELEQCLRSAAAASQGEIILPDDLLAENIQRYRDDEDSGGDMLEGQTSETLVEPTHRNLFDLPVTVFCQFISDAAEADVTDDQITRWWIAFSNYARELAVRAKRKIGDWRVEWNTESFDLPDLSERIKTVIDDAVSQLSNLRYRMEPEPIEEADLVSIVGKTLKGSLTAVLPEIVKEHGGDKESVARELDISLERLERWLSYGENENDTNDSLQTSIEPLRQRERLTYEETKKLLIEPTLVFILENFAHIRWRDKNMNSQMRTVHLDLRVLSKRLVGEHGYIYFGGMTFSQIEESIYRRARHLYANLTEAAEALNVDPRTIRRFWTED